MSVNLTSQSRKQQITMKQKSRKMMAAFQMYVRKEWHLHIKSIKKYKSKKCTLTIWSKNIHDSTVLKHIDIYRTLTVYLWAVDCAHIRLFFRSICILTQGMTASPTSISFTLNIIQCYWPLSLLSAAVLIFNEGASMSGCHFSAALVLPWRHAGGGQWGLAHHLPLEPDKTGI